MSVPSAKPHKVLSGFLLSTHPFTWDMANETKPHLATSSFEIESHNFSPGFLFSRLTPPSPSATHQTCFLDPSLPFLGQVPASQCSFWNEGPKTTQHSRCSFTRDCNIGSKEEISDFSTVTPPLQGQADEKQMRKQAHILSIIKHEIWTDNLVEHIAEISRVFCHIIVWPNNVFRPE